jgi:hypothetical protein
MAKAHTAHMFSKYQIESTLLTQCHHFGFLAVSSMSSKLWKKFLWFLLMFAKYQIESTLLTQCHHFGFLAVSSMSSKLCIKFEETLQGRK